MRLPQIAVFTRVAPYAGGNGTDRLEFTYTALAGDAARAVAADGDGLGPTARFPWAAGTWVRRRALPLASQDARLEFPRAPWASALAVDGNRPAKVAAVYAAEPGAGEEHTLGAGDLLVVAVRFNRAVVVGRDVGEHTPRHHHCYGHCCYCCCQDQMLVAHCY